MAPKKRRRGDGFKHIEQELADLRRMLGYVIETLCLVIQNLLAMAAAVRRSASDWPVPLTPGSGSPPPPGGPHSGGFFPFGPGGPGGGGLCGSPPGGSMPPNAGGRHPP